MCDLEHATCLGQNYLLGAWFCVISASKAVHLEYLLPERSTEVVLQDAGVAGRPAGPCEPAEGTGAIHAA